MESIQREVLPPQRGIQGVENNLGYAGKAPVRVALIQMACAERKEVNVARALDYIEKAALEGANLVCLQELFASTYPCQSEDHARFAEAEPIPGPTSDRLASAAARHGVVVVGSLFERRAPGVYHNTAIVLDADGQLTGTYRKMHIPDDPHYYEKFYFTPGDADQEGGRRNGFGAFPTRYGRIGACVCWDQWYPEAARLTAMAGADMIVYPTAIGWLPQDKEEHGQSQHAAWETMMRSHAIANGVFVVAANRVGREGALEFWGASLIVNPYGQVLIRGSHDREEILLAECDFGQIEAARTHWPFFRDRRVDAYGNLTRRWVDG